jgi:hypothetical protein
MKVKELKAELEMLGLSTVGKKADLEARLAEAQAPAEEVAEEPAEEVAEEPVEEVEEEPAEEPEEVSEEPNMSGGDDCKCEWCAAGWAHRD